MRSILDQFKAQDQAFFEANEKDALVANDVSDLLGKFSLATIKGEVYFVIGSTIVLVGNANTDEYALLNLQNDALLVCNNLGNELLAELEKAFPKAKVLKYTVYKEVPPKKYIAKTEAQEPELLTPCAPPSTEPPVAPKKKKAAVRKRPVLGGGETTAAAASESHEEIVKKEKVAVE
jgi:hypothetical protein